MKYLYTFLGCSIMILLASCGTSRSYTQENYNQPYSQEQQPGEITYQQFYDELSPYGNWINYPGQGYVWVPNVPSFRPYATNGQWVYTNLGWTWVSNYNWGWAPFHYGRWLNDASFGWMWVPGYEWAPAWVAWRGGGDYYGWAPLGPGIGINIAIGSMPANYWNFVPRRYINSPRINNYYVNQSRNVTIINNTTIINNINNTTVINDRNNNRNRTVYNPGPSVIDVERGTNTKIRQVKLVDRNAPGTAEVTNRYVSMYRPGVQANSAKSVNIKPVRITNPQELEAVRERNNSIRNNNAQQTQQLPVRKFENVNPQPTSTPQRLERNTVVPKENSNPVNEGETPRLNPIDRVIEQPIEADMRQINVPQRNTNRINNNTIPPVDNPRSNIPQNQPVRRFNNSGNSPGNQRINSPAANNTPVNRNNPVNSSQSNVPMRRIQNNTNAKNSQSINHQNSEIKVQSVRPVQHVTRETPVERPAEERK